MSDLPELPADLYRRLAMADDLSDFYDREDVVEWMESRGFEQSGDDGTWYIEDGYVSGPVVADAPLETALRHARHAMGDDTPTRALELKVIRHRGGPSEMPPDYEIGDTDEQ